MITYLIQRGIIEDRDHKKGIDSIVSFDYMGAAEYEFGALPDSLKRLRSKINEYIYLDVLINGKYISVFCNDNQKSDIKGYLQQLANGRMYTKLGSYFDKYVNPLKYDLEFQVRHPLKINFWWDIENDLMFWVKNPEFESKFKTIITTNYS
jgi:hypothetical protein